MLERHVKRAAEIATLAAIFVLPIKNHESTTRVIQALSGQKVDCSYGEATGNSYSSDLIAVFGAGTSTDEFGNLQPNSFQIGRMQAAAEAYARGLAPKILLIDGIEPSILKSVKTYLQLAVSFFSEGKVSLPRSAVSLLTDSMNTASNVRDLKDYMNDADMERVVLITDEFHSQRAEILACNYGINSQMKTVEEMVEKDQDSSMKMQVLAIKENFEIVLLAYDPKGYLPTSIKQLTKLSSLP